jgi:hypothetical protein
MSESDQPDAALTELRAADRTAAAGCVLPEGSGGTEAVMATSDESDDRPDIDIERGDGATPAMNLPGPKAADDRAVTPGNLGWDEPHEGEPQALEGAVRRAGDDQNGEPAALPSDAAGH